MSPPEGTITPSLTTSPKYFQSGLMDDDMEDPLEVYRKAMESVGNDPQFKPISAEIMKITRHPLAAVFSHKAKSHGTLGRRNRGAPR